MACCLLVSSWLKRAIYYCDTLTLKFGVLKWIVDCWMIFLSTVSSEKITIGGFHVTYLNIFCWKWFYYWLWSFGRLRHCIVLCMFWSWIISVLRNRTVYRRFIFREGLEDICLLYWLFQWRIFSWTFSAEDFYIIAVIRYWIFDIYELDI